MTAALDSQKLGAVFQDRPDIVQGIENAANSPASIRLFNEIARHIYDQLHGSGEPAQKRRRVDLVQASAPNGAAGPRSSGNAAEEAVLLEVKELSVSSPQRKKYELCLTQNFLYTRAPGTTAPVSGVTYAWRDIEYAFYLPVPDKAQVQHNYVLFPRGSSLPSKTSQPAAEPLVFMVPATAPKEGTVGGSEAGSAAAVSDTYKSLLHWAFDRRFKAAGNPVEIVSADASKFHSVIRQAHRPNEKAVHVSGFRGSKDGHLFFLENGILWGFKKPLIFIPMTRIVAVSYTNILQITFNIVVEVFSHEGDVAEEMEFGMLDQQDYGGIDNYLKRNRLQDRSMAEQRKGKLQLAENKGARMKAGDGQDGDAGGADGQDDDGMTELRRAEFEAEQQLHDDEDEEEDYDPGSEGESEGSGASSEEEDETGDGEEDATEDGEDEGGEDEAEEEKAKAKQPSVKETPARRPISQASARQGRAATRNSRPTADDDDERFDVVG